LPSWIIGRWEVDGKWGPQNVFFNWAVRVFFVTLLHVIEYSHFDDLVHWVGLAHQTMRPLLIHLASVGLHTRTVINSSMDPYRLNGLIQFKMSCFD
jgi:hypothetical protein